MISSTTLLEIIAGRTALEWMQSTRNTSALLNFQNATGLWLYDTPGIKDPIFTGDGITVGNPATGFAHQLISNRCDPCALSFGNYKVCFTFILTFFSGHSARRTCPLGQEWCPLFQPYRARSILSKSGRFYRTHEQVWTECRFSQQFCKTTPRFQGVDVHPSVTRCGLQEYCICQVNEDCGVDQVCELFNGYMTCNDAPENGP